MYFDITNYNVTRLWVFFALSGLLSFFLVRKRITSFIDPLVFQCVWASSMLAFSSELMLAKGSMWSIFFVVISFIYLFALGLTSPKIDVTQKLGRARTELPLAHYLRLLVSCLLLLKFAWWEQWSYLLQEGIVGAYKYRLLYLGTGRNVLDTIIGSTIGTLFMYQLFCTFFFEKRRAYLMLAVGLIGHSVLINSLTGSRSQIIGVIIGFGGGVYYFRHFIDLPRYRTICNWMCAIGMTVGVMALVGVSALYEARGSAGSVSLEAGLRNVENRIFANADGIEYFVKYDGASVLQNTDVFSANISIFLKRFITVPGKSVGWILLENAINQQLGGAQGPNFMVHLQSYVVTHSILLAPFYVLFIVLLSNWIRTVRSRPGMLTDIPCFYLATSIFGLATDSEYFIFTTAIFFTGFVVLVVPIYCGCNVVAKVMSLYRVEFRLEKPKFTSTI